MKIWLRGCVVDSDGSIPSDSVRELRLIEDVCEKLGFRAVMTRPEPVFWTGAGPLMMREVYAEPLQVRVAGVSGEVPASDAPEVSSPVPPLTPGEEA